MGNYFKVLTVLILFSALWGIDYKRGEFATCSAKPDSAEFDWASKFDIIQSGGFGDFISTMLCDSFHAAEVKTVLAYEWMPAGYHYLDSPSSDDPFMQWIYANRYEKSLNPEGPFPHSAEYPDLHIQDYYYDLGDTEVVVRRVNYILHSLDSIGYDGIFFDWASGAFIDAEEYTTIKDTFYSRHPDMVYSQAVGKFYETLRDSNPDIIIITNQGFRRAEYILPTTNYDMTESYGTDYEYIDSSAYVRGIGPVSRIPVTKFYAVSEDEFAGSIGDHLHYLNVLLNVSREYGGESFRKIIYMNYAAPRFVYSGEYIDSLPEIIPLNPKTAIYFGYCLAKLGDQIAYTEVPFDHRLERDSIYFYDLGDPVASGYDTLLTAELDSYYVKYYEKGLVILGDWQCDSIRITLNSPYIPDSAFVYNPFRGNWFVALDNELVLGIFPEFDSYTERYKPTGRVLLYDFDTTLSIVNQNPTNSVNLLIHFGEKITIENLPEGAEFLNLYDISGRLVKVCSLDKISVNLNNLPSGIYFATILARHHIWTSRILLIK